MPVSKALGKDCMQIERVPRCSSMIVLSDLGSCSSRAIILFSPKLSSLISKTRQDCYSYSPLPHASPDDRPAVRSTSTIYLGQPLFPMFS